MSDLGEALRTARHARLLSQSALGRHFEVSKSAVSQWEAGRNIPDRKKIAALAEFLGLDQALLMTLAGRKRASAGVPRLSTSPIPSPPGRADIPVWASADAGNDKGNDGAMVLVEGPVDWIRRSERLQGVTAPFAFYAIGGAMSPAIEHGDQMVVNPSLPPVPGKDHVFLQRGENGTAIAILGRLLDSGPTAWRVRRFNPGKDVDLPKSTWSKALMIAEKRVG